MFSVGMHYGRSKRRRSILTYNPTSSPRSLRANFRNVDRLASVRFMRCTYEGHGDVTPGKQTVVNALWRPSMRIKPGDEAAFNPDDSRTSAKRIREAIILVGVRRPGTTARTALCPRPTGCQPIDGLRSASGRFINVFRDEIGTEGCRRKDGTRPGASRKCIEEEQSTVFSYSNRKAIAKNNYFGRTI